jgi:hypothetical protein
MRRQNSTIVRICQQVTQLGGALLRHQGVAARADDRAIRGAVLIVVRVGVVERPSGGRDPDEKDGGKAEHRKT